MHMTVEADLVKITYKLQPNLKNCKYLKFYKLIINLKL
jgi:hypothetical protein